MRYENFPRCSCCGRKKRVIVYQSWVSGESHAVKTHALLCTFCEDIKKIPYELGFFDEEEAILHEIGEIYLKWPKKLPWRTSIHKTTDAQDGNNEQAIGILPAEVY